MLQWNLYWKGLRRTTKEKYIGPSSTSLLESLLSFTCDTDCIFCGSIVTRYPFRFQQGLASSAGDMEFSQAMTKMPSKQNKQVAYTGTESIIGKFLF